MYLIYNDWGDIVFFTKSSDTADLLRAEGLHLEWIERIEELVLALSPEINII